MLPVDFVKALGVALLILAVDMACAALTVSIWAMLTGQTGLTPADPRVIEISSLSTRVCGPILFALFVWLFQRKRRDRNAWAFALSVFGFYFLLDAGVALVPMEGAEQPATGIAAMMQPAVIATMALKLVGALIGAGLARRATHAAK